MKTVLISGFQGNLGVAVTKQFLSEGLTVVGIDKTLKEGRLPDHPNLHSFEIDLLDEQECNKGMASILEKHDISIAINLAGGFAMGSVENTDSEAVQSMVDLNFKTAYHVTRTLLPAYKRNTGIIIYVTSKPALEHGGSFTTAYSLSKSILVKLVELVNEEGKGSIRAYAIAPEIIDTPINRQSMPDADFSAWVKPEEIASSLAHICSDQTGITQPIIRMYNKK